MAGVDRPVRDGYRREHPDFDPYEITTVPGNLVEAYRDRPADLGSTLAASDREHRTGESRLAGSEASSLQQAGSEAPPSRSPTEHRKVPVYLPNRADGSPLAASPAAPSSGRPYASSIARRVPYRLPYVVRFPPPTDRLEMTIIGICPPAGEP